MDGTSLPLLAAAPNASAVGSAASAIGPVASPGDGFSAILGATDLTGLSADQQAALRQLLATPAEALRPAVEAVGNALPQAAIRGLLGALGVALDPQALAHEAAVRPVGSAAEARPASEADGGGGLAGMLLAMLLQGTGAAPQAPRAGPGAPGSIAAEGAEGLVPDASPLGAVLSATGVAATVAPATGDDDRPAASYGLWAMIHHAGRSPGVADAARPPVAPAPDGTLAAQPDSDGASVPAAFLAALESVARDEGGDTPLAADLPRGLATALDAVGAAAARSGLAASHEAVPARVAALVADTVSVPVGERGWERAFGERVLWLVGQQVQAAEVKLNPPHLGPVEVRLSLTGQDANVSFTVAHGATRDAIEQAIPRLRELFAQHQLQIVNVDVGQRDASSQASQGDRNGQWGTPSPGGTVPAVAAVMEPTVAVRPGMVSGLVDEYA